MNADETRDWLIGQRPERAKTVLTRDAIAEKWCAEHGKSKNDLTMAEILEIRSLSEWRDA